MLWTTAAVATHPSCRSLDRRKKPLPCGQQEEQLKPTFGMCGVQVLKKTGLLFFSCPDFNPRLTSQDPSTEPGNTSVMLYFLPSPRPLLSVHVRWDVLIISTLTRTRGCFKSGCNGQQGEPVLEKGRKCARMREVWGWWVQCMLPSLGRTHNRLRIPFQGTGTRPEQCLF